MGMNRLRDLREDKELSQRQVAEILGTSTQYYQKYERVFAPFRLNV